MLHMLMVRLFEASNSTFGSFSDVLCRAIDPIPPLYGSISLEEWGPILRMDPIGIWANLDTLR